MKLFAQILILLLVFSACSKVEDLMPENEPSLIGIWVKENDKNLDRSKVFVRKDSFDNNHFGYSFMDGNKLLIRIKVECGENPKYENIEGNYLLTNDTLIDIKYFYNRKTEYNIIIKSLTYDSLIISNL